MCNPVKVHTQVLVPATMTKVAAPDATLVCGNQACKHLVGNLHGTLDRLHCDH
jgi:hypothetical protein